MMGTGTPAAKAFAAMPSGQAPDVNQDRVYAQTKIPVETFEIVKTHAHNTGDYTEALFFHKGFLYEATGEFGRSTLKKLDPTGSKCLCESRLEQRYFGEGAVGFEDRIYRLTYLSTLGFIYRDDDLELIGNFRYPGQGWGLTSDGNSLVMSNGSAAVLFLNPRTFAVDRYIVVTDSFGEVGFLNELEYVDGEIYANVWKTNYIVRFSASTGEVTGWLDLNGLDPDPEKLVYPYVLNGIAHNAKDGTLLVTGKNWPSLWHTKSAPIGK